MCIRDSFGAAHHFQAELVVLVHGADLLGALFLHQFGRDCCLLYTSDAADERSSVDLGGRRIIKKKKLF